MATHTLQSMPKIDLHTHLDCATSYEFVSHFVPAMSHDEYTANFQAPAKCVDLVDFLNCIDPAIALLQTEEALTLAARDMVRQFQNDNVAYAEVRFAPLLHTDKGLSTHQVVEAVLAGFRGSDPEVGVILCDMRPYSEELSLETFDLVERYYGQGVVALDLANDEFNFGLDTHVKAFARAREAGIPATAHAGEAASYKSVLETLERLQPQRIGHGVRSIEDADTVGLLADRDIHLEVCPTVNIQVDVFDTIGDHPIHRLREAGVSVGVNTDARATSGTTLAGEYRLLHDTFGWTVEDFASVNREMLRHAFCSDETRARVGAVLA